MRALVRSRTKGEWLRRLGADVILGDIRDPTAVRSAAEGCDLAFHLVSNRYQENARFIAYHETNVCGTENVISAAADAGVRRLVFTSSINVYGRLSAEPISEETPTSPALCHDRSKLQAERLVLERGPDLGLSVVVARLPWVFGTGAFRFRKPFHQVIEESSFRFYGPYDPWRNIAHVDDIVDGLKRCAAISWNDPRLYLLPGHNAKLSEVLQLIADEAGVQLRISRRPLWPVECMSNACRLLLSPFGTESNLMYGVEFFVRNQKIDGSKAKRELGYAPSISLRETITAMIGWYRKTHYADSNEPDLAEMAGAI